MKFYSIIYIKSKKVVKGKNILKTIILLKSFLVLILRFITQVNHILNKIIKIDNKIQRSKITLPTNCTIFSLKSKIKKKFSLMNYEI